MQTESENDYRVLDLEPGASLEDVKRSYRELALVWHPDRHTDNPRLSKRAHKKMVEINLAFERICDALVAKPGPEPSPKRSRTSGQHQHPKNESNGPWTNSLGMQFVPVPGTAVHFSIWETRVQDYGAYAKAAWVLKRAWRKPGFPQSGTHPVVNVSWEDAKNFCTWLTKKERREGLLTVHQEYRLPRDAEWSWGVGIGDREPDGPPSEKNRKLKGVYPWGNQWPPPKGVGNYPPSMGTASVGQTTPVGTFPPNPKGLFDMGGNVWEWCEDLFGPGLWAAWRVQRGGAWKIRDEKELSLSSARVGGITTERAPTVGFRCVLVR